VRLPGPLVHQRVQRAEGVADPGARGAAAVRLADVVVVLGRGAAAAAPVVFFCFLFAVCFRG